MISRLTNLRFLILFNYEIKKTNKSYIITFFNYFCYDFDTYFVSHLLDELLHHTLLNFCTEMTFEPSTSMVTVHPSSVNSRIVFVDFSPSFLAVCSEMDLFPSTVTKAETCLPSGVVSSKASPTLNFNSMVFNVVEVLINQDPPPASVTSIIGVDTVAAFLNRKLTPRALRNSS